MAIQPTFRYATRFAEGLAAIRIGDTDEMGFIDKLGRLVIPSIRCVLALPFNGGLARIQGQDDRTGYIDVTGRFVWPLQ